MHLSGIFIYPVKSLRGVAISTAGVDALGLDGDRRFMVVDETGLLLTQRVLPAMALINTALAKDRLTLSAEGRGSIQVSTQPDTAAPLRRVSVWKSTDLAAEDCGDEPARWLTAFLQAPCRLVRIGAAFNRPILSPEKAQPGDIVSFADAYPFLLVGEASLADLNDRLVAQGGESLPMNRFRPNLVVSGSPAFAEDAWPRLRIGDVLFRAGGPCSRCTVTTTDQLTSERAHEPLRTLATYRRDAANPHEVNFGQNLIHETKRGTLRIGDVVEITS